MLLNILLRRREPEDPAVWHRWATVFPVRLIDGTWSINVGQLWRRRGLKGWEYQEDPETDAQWWERQL